MDEQKLITTYRFRIKGASAIRRLRPLAGKVNLVWNYANETSFHAIRNHGKWISNSQLDRLTAGCSKELGLHSQTIQAITKEYVTRRIQHKKRKLRWGCSGGSRRSLGWIPFKASGVVIQENQIKYAGQWFRFWNSWDGKNGKQRNWKEESIKILVGCFAEDSKGDWYLNLTCEINPMVCAHLIEEAGGDPGLKDIMVFSDGDRIANPGIYRDTEEKLAKAQRAKKKRQARNIQIKIKNQRRDYLHKQTTKSAKKFRTLYIGDVSGRFLQKTNGKSSADASVGIARNHLSYKTKRYSGRFYEVSESSSTITCSHCFQKTGPGGLSDLGVREWSCAHCKTIHDRDVNAARNILRFGRESLKQPERAA